MEWVFGIAAVLGVWGLLIRIQRLEDRLAKLEGNNPEGQELLRTKS